MFPLHDGFNLCGRNINYTPNKYSYNDKNLNSLWFSIMRGTLSLWTKLKMDSTEQGHHKLLTAFEESMAEEADKQTSQASDGEEKPRWYLSWTF